MSLRIYCIAAIAAMTLHACAKHTQPPTEDNTSNSDTRTPVENAIAANVTVT